MRAGGVALALAGLLASGPARAIPSYTDLVPNGDNLGTRVGHSVGQPRLDSFGLDFEGANRQWTLELCQQDSDGDGRTNGEELGDPECIWKVGDPFPSVVNITIPGRADTLDDAFDFTPRDVSGLELGLTVYYALSAVFFLLASCHYTNQERTLLPHERTVNLVNWFVITVLLGMVGLAILIFCLREPPNKQPSGLERTRQTVQNASATLGRTLGRKKKTASMAEPANDIEAGDAGVSALAAVAPADAADDAKGDATAPKDGDDVSELTPTKPGPEPIVDDDGRVFESEADFREFESRHHSNRL